MVLNFRKRPAVGGAKFITSKEAEVIALLRKYDDAYYNKKKPLVSDDVYNTLRAKAQNQFPKNSYFKEVGAAPKKGTAVDLPLTLTRMSRIRPDSVAPWLNGVNDGLKFMHYSHKIDGLCAILHYRQGQLFRVFTRGNDATGQDITRFAKYIKSIPKHIGISPEARNKPIDQQPILSNGDAIFTGELCVTWAKFDKHNDKYKGDKKKLFASPRVMAQASVNRNEVDEYLIGQVDCVMHGVLFPEPMKPERDWYLLEECFPVVTPNGKLMVDPKIGNRLATLYESAKDESEYPIDGFVLQATDGADTHYIAMKRDADKQTVAQTSVTKIEVNMSARNLAKPTIHIKPVKIDGYTISTLTGNNIREIESLKIGPGSVVNVVRAGDVIPHMLKTGQFKPTAAKKPFYLECCPDCGGELSWTFTANGKEGADLQCTDELCRESKRTMIFLERMQIDGLGEANIETLAHERGMAEVLALPDKEFTKLFGKLGPGIRANLHHAMECDMAKIMYASGIFTSGTQSLGVNTIVAILTALKRANISATKLLEGEGTEYHGVTLEMTLPPVNTSRLFIAKLPEFRVFYQQEIGKAHKPTKTSDRLGGYVFTFSGFRDANLAEDIRRAGGIYTESLSKKVTHVVSLNMPEPAKLEKAKKYGTRLLKVQELKHILQGYDSVELLENDASAKPKNGEDAFLNGKIDRSKDRLPNKTTPPPFVGKTGEQWESGRKAMKEWRGDKEKPKFRINSLQARLARAKANRR
jgi:NAD-dependent DNA ligase